MMQRETQTFPYAVAIDNRHQPGSATEMGFADILNEGINPLDGSKKSTKYDQRDMHRLGKVQELNGCFSLAWWHVFTDLTA
jgi:hypothetical protein